MLSVTLTRYPVSTLAPAPAVPVLERYDAFGAGRNSNAGPVPQQDADAPHRMRSETTGSGRICPCDLRCTP
jgi:hypothetical protein